MSQQPFDMGPEEEAVRQRISPENWRAVSLDHFGPDGTEVVARFLFFVCPVCAAVIPSETPDHDLRSEHGDHHVQQARALDGLGRTVETLREEAARHAHPHF